MLCTGEGVLVVDVDWEGLAEDEDPPSRHENMAIDAMATIKIIRIELNLLSNVIVILIKNFECKNNVICLNNGKSAPLFCLGTSIPKKITLPNN